MKRDEVLKIISEHREQLEKLGVKSLLLFGSVARDEAGPDSDVDFLVELNGEIGLFEFIKIRLLYIWKIYLTVLLIWEQKTL